MGKEMVGIVKRVLVEFYFLNYDTGINNKCDLGNVFEEVKQHISNRWGSLVQGENRLCYFQ